MSGALPPAEADSSPSLLGFGWVLLLSTLILLAGVGMRGPWPADEPRFALIARDMLATGNWLIPQVGGDVYADKPPIYFWLLAGSIWLTGSVRLGFLVPSIVAGIITVAVVYDLTRRLYDRATAVWAGLVLLTTFQFALEFKQAQIDPTLTMLTTFSLYALVRHLLLGPAWGWYALGGLAAGVAVITKGVGFLPLLVLLPYSVLACRGWDVAVRDRTWRWAWAPLATLAAVALWLAPLLIAAARTPQLAAYRDEILFGQTIDRYVAAEGHLHPWWYFVAAVIPWAWLPLTLAAPWLWRYWRDALRARDPRIGLLLTWVVLVVAFFSFSSGKRGVYVLPAVPVLAVITAPYAEALLRRAWLNRLAFSVLLLIAVAAATALIHFGWLDPGALVEAMQGYSASGVELFLPIALLAAGALVAARLSHGLIGLVGFFFGFWVIYGWWLWPLVDAARSGRALMERTYAALPANAELGIVAAKESLLLYADGAITNFGHRRRDEDQERYDAARWLAGGAGRYLLLRTESRPGCFDAAPATVIGRAHGLEWQLVPHDAASASCAGRGRTENAIRYEAPLP